MELKEYKAIRLKTVEDKPCAIKQVIIVNKKLGMSQGKIAAQVAHAAFNAGRKADEEIVKKWMEFGHCKIVLQVETPQEIVDLKELADKCQLPTAMIIDEGMNEIPTDSITALGIGPHYATKIDPITYDLRLL